MTTMTEYYGSGDGAADDAARKALAVVGKFDYSAMAIHDSGFTDEDVYGDGLAIKVNIRQLPTLKLAAGGVKAWHLTNVEREGTGASLRGVILALRYVRIYWGKGFGEGGKDAPLCSSEDGYVGNPREEGRYRGASGDCETCRLAEFGSSGVSLAPACQLRMHLYTAVAGIPAPVVVDLPSTSVEPTVDYLAKLRTLRLPHWALETVFKVGTDVNSAGVEYAVADLEMGERVQGPDQITFWRNLAQQYRELLIPKRQRQAERYRPQVAAPQPPPNTTVFTPEGQIVNTTTGEIIGEVQDAPPAATPPTEQPAAEPTPFEVVDAPETVGVPAELAQQIDESYAQPQAAAPELPNAHAAAQPPADDAPLPFEVPAEVVDHAAADIPFE